MDSKTYPLLIHNLSARLCVVIGGGEVATRKVLGLIDGGAKPKVVSPNITDVLKELHQDALLDYVARDYQWGDLDGAFLAFSCSNVSEVNQTVLHEAHVKNVLINHSEDATESDFSTPAIIRQSSLLLTISSEGKSPSLTRYIKERLEQSYDKRYGKLTDLLADVREELKALSRTEREELMSELTSESYLNQLNLDEQAAQQELILLLKSNSI